MSALVGAFRVVVCHYTFVVYTKGINQQMILATLLLAQADVNAFCLCARGQKVVCFDPQPPHHGQINNCLYY